MAVMMVAAGVWSVGYAFEIGFAGLAEKIFWAKVQYLGICSIPYSVLAFGISYSGRRLGSVAWASLAVVPLLTLGLVFTNERHDLVWSSISPGPENLFLVLGRGPAFWVYWIYSYILIITGMALIATVIFRSRRLYLMQSATLVLGLLAPWLANSLYVLELLPGDVNFDLTPFGFTVTGIMLWWGLFRFGLLDIVPVAHHRVIESIPDGVIVLDSRGRILDLNPATAPLLSVPVPRAVGRLAGEVVAGWKELSDDLETGSELRAGDREYEISLTTIKDARVASTREGIEDGTVAIFRDVTKRKKVERRLRESEERYRRLVELSPDAIIVHSDCLIDYINEAGVRAVGASGVAEIVGRPVVDFVHPEYAIRMEERLRRTYSEDYTSAAEEKFVRLDGRVMDVETAVMSIPNSDDPAAQLIFREITERKAAEEKLTYQAFHDTLTGLPNRSLFTRRLQETLDSRESRIVGVLFLDLDGFKLVNDSLGHDYGDSLLVAVAGRLGSCVRPGDTVARMGGDEFTILLEDIYDVGEAEAVAQRVMEELIRPFEIWGHEIFVTTSIGIATGKPEEHLASDMLRNADIAMYEAKHEGGTNYRIFRQGMEDPSIRHLEMKNDIHQALKRDEFAVYYQPKVAVATGEICGIEALLRWRHPTRGLLLPQEFLPVAKSSGTMPEIETYVLSEALRQTAEWMDGLPRSSALTLGINFSVKQLLNPSFADEALVLIESSGISPENLEFEITEDALIERNSPAVSTLKKLRGAGIRLSVDDFGAGYSSLSRLGAVPIDTIKIDRSLVGELDRGNEDATIVAGIIGLSHTLGKAVVAEGVESDDQLARLAELGCDFAQGNHLYKPLKAADILRLLVERGSAEPESVAGA